MIKNWSCFPVTATVVQGKSVLKSDKLFLYYKNEANKKDKAGTIETDKAGDLEG